MSTSSSPQDAISRLVQGYHSFRVHYFQNERNTLFEELVKHGQKPKVMLIACSDSRVSPSIVMNAEPGELFVVRNVASLVPAYDAASPYRGLGAALEFAVLSLKVQHIIVLGHSFCGGVRALLQSDLTQDSSFVAGWMQIAAEAKEETMKKCQHQSIDEQAKFCEEQSVCVSVKNLLSYSFVNQKVSEGVLSLHGWHFNLKTGTMRRYDPLIEKFVNLDEAAKKHAESKENKEKAAFEQGENKDKIQAKL